MSAGFFRLYASGIEAIANGVVDLDNDAFNVILATSAYTPNPNVDGTYSDVSANEVAAGSGYTTGGVTISPLTVTRSAGQVTVDSATNPSWTAVGTITGKWAILVRRAGGALAGTDLLIGYIDLAAAGGSVSATNASFAVNWNANGIFAFFQAMPAAPVTRTAGATLTTADMGVTQIFDISSPATLVLPALSSVTPGSPLKVRNSHSSTSWVLLDGNASETVNGQAIYHLFPGESVDLVATASGWAAFGVDDFGWRCVLRQSANDSAQVDFVFPDGFSRVRFEIQGLRPGTDGGIPALRHSRDGGATYLAGATDYTLSGIGSNNGTVTSSAQTNGNSIILAPGMDNNNTSVNGDIVLETNAGDNVGLTANTLIFGTVLSNGTGAVELQPRMGRTNGTGRINAARFLMSTGNISEGQFAFFARR